MLLYPIFILLSLLLSALFSAAETAFVALSPVQVKIISTKHPLRKGAINFLQNHKEDFISAVVVGNNAANVVFSVLSTRYSMQLFGDSIVVLVTFLVIIIMLIFGEIPPKQLAFRYNMKFIAVFVIPLCVIFILLWPTARFFSLFSALINMFLKDKTVHDIKDISKEHLMQLLHQIRFAKNISKDKTRRITRMLTLTDVPVEAIMTRRTEVRSLPEDITVKEAVNKLQEKFYSHIPIYGNDDLEHIIGVVHAPSLIHALHTGKNNSLLKNIMEKTMVLQESNSIEEAFSLLQNKNTDFSVVFDEYGGFAGIVTISDIAFYVFSAQSELSYNVTKNTLITKKYVEFSKNQYIAQDEKVTDTFFLHGSAHLSDIEEIACITLDPRPESQTIGGYLSEYTGGSHILYSDDKHKKQQKNIHHPLLGIFTILEEKDGRITFLQWKPSLKNE